MRSVRLIQQFKILVLSLISIQSTLHAAPENSPLFFPIEGDKIDVVKAPSANALDSRSDTSKENLQSIDWDTSDHRDVTSIIPPMPISKSFDLDDENQSEASADIPNKKMSFSSDDQESYLPFTIDSEEKKTSSDYPRIKSAKEAVAAFPTPPEEQPVSEVAQAAPEANTPPPPPPAPIPVEEQTAQQPPKTILINFNNVNIVEYIRFISRISGKNFVFDETDLQFNVTIISEEPTTIENIMTALLQELRIHDLVLLEEGNNIVIHRNPKVSAISTVVADGQLPKNADLVTQVFRLNTIDPKSASDIVKPLVSDTAIVDVLKDSRHLIVTDLASNIAEIAKLLKSVDSPVSGLVVGQYLVKNTYPDNLLNLAEKVIRPIAGDQPLTLVVHAAANSILIISSPYIVDRGMAIMQYLDQTQGVTGIIDLNAASKIPSKPAEELQGGRWELDSKGNWIFRPATSVNERTSPNPPDGVWTIDSQGNWYFDTSGKALNVLQRGGDKKGPNGKWLLDSQGLWIYQLNPGETIAPQALIRPTKAYEELPAGNIERTQFYVYKLKYRKGDQIQQSLSNIATSLSQSGTSNQDFVSTINSAQWLEGSNSLIFTGTPETLEKIKALIGEIDTPLRQVFIEMLILQTTVSDSLEYGVNWSTRFGGGDTAGAQAFLTGASTLPGAMDTSGVGLIPNASSMAIHPQFNLGIIGQTLTHGGTTFATIGALVSALHDNNRVDIIMNPKILVEDNTAAEIFVGINTPFQTQQISNDVGQVLTNNFEFRDVGTRLKVTPLIGTNDIITLNIVEEVSSLSSGAQTSGSVNAQPQTTNINTTTTTVHIPNGYFLVMSGMLQDTNNRLRNQLPCLGGIPILGAAFSHKRIDDNKLNLMIFLRPLIIDSEEEIDNITKHQQDIFKYKNRMKPMWEYEVDEALDFFNLIDTTYEDEDQEL